jgi:hypothetical protein
VAITLECVAITLECVAITLVSFIFTGIRVKITLVCNCGCHITHCGWKLHFACKNHSCASWNRTHACFNHIRACQIHTAGGNHTLLVKSHSACRNYTLCACWNHILSSEIGNYPHGSAPYQITQVIHFWRVAKLLRWATAVPAERCFFPSLHFHKAYYFILRLQYPQITLSPYLADGNCSYSSPTWKAAWENLTRNR